LMHVRYDRTGARLLAACDSVWQRPLELDGETT
jgi:hypothetical protein